MKTMLKPAYSFVLVFLFSIFFSSAQMKLEGKIINAVTKSPVAFVNIGIKKKNTGTISKADGSFVLLIPANYLKDTLHFSASGYAELATDISKIISGKQNVFKLQPKPVTYSKAEVLKGKFIEKKYGIKNDPLFNFVDASINQQDIFEIGNLVELPTSPVKISSLNLFIAEDSNDSATFRVNFYEYRNKEPGQKLNKYDIIQTHVIKRGWLTFDLSMHEIKLGGNFVAALEFIPAGNKITQIFYEIKLGGFSKSFYRESSLGEWQVPPHHYRMFLTALVSEDN